MLDGKVVAITGASAGVGRATVRELARRGAHVGLIARDPNAYWDDSQNKVVSDLHPSPRVFPIPIYDPIYYTTAKMEGRYADFKVANWIGFFLESTQGNGISGRIIPIAGIRDATAGPAPDGAFPKAIRLVK